MPYNVIKAVAINSIISVTSLFITFNIITTRTRFIIIFIVLTSSSVTDFIDSTTHFINTINYFIFLLKVF